MNSPLLISSLEHFPVALRALVAPWPMDTLRRRPEPGGWSALEILGHLADEEELDFRVRLECTLAGNDEWPPIAPEQWVTERRCNDADPAGVLSRFEARRTENVAWLKALGAADWSAEHRHPKFGSMRAGELLAAWAAHDLLHLRQLTRRLYDEIGTASAPYGTGYAGNWPAGK